MVKQCYYENVSYFVISKFIKEEEASELLSRLGIKTQLTHFSPMSHFYTP